MPFLCYYYWHNELEMFLPRSWSWEDAIWDIFLVYLTWVRKPPSSTIEGVMHTRKIGFVPTTGGPMHVCPRLGRQWWLAGGCCDRGAVDYNSS